MDAAGAKALLQRKEGSSSVYDHLVEVILKVLAEQPANALGSFENISARVKAAAFSGDSGSGASAGAGGSSVHARAGGDAAAAEVRAALERRLASEVALLKAPGGESGSPGEAVQDYTEESHYLEWAGVSLGRAASFRLHLALKHLAAKYPVKGLRFWGKVFGRSADYYIAEGTMEAEEAEEDAKDALGHTVQKTGEGPNRWTYFVCHDVGGEWTRLPNVTPHQVVVARKIRRAFTGDLSAPVPGHPPFPGVEMNYLRAQIALITAGTVLAPAGAFMPPAEDDAEGALQPAEEWEGPDMTTLE